MLNLISSLASWKIKLALAAILAGAFFACCFWLGYQVGSSTYHIKLAACEKSAAEKTAQQASDSLAQFAARASAIQTAAKEFNTSQAAIKSKLDEIKKGITHAQPLPDDCKPGPVRLRVLQDAIDAANSTP